MNKLKIIFCLISCLVFTANFQIAEAQTIGSDKILAAGNPPLKQSDVDKVIEFYEWAFETNFKTDERRLFREFAIKGFRHNAVESRKANDLLIELTGQMREKDAASQAKMRQSFNKDFVKSLRDSNDEYSQMLLNIYERGQNSNENQGRFGENSTDSNIKPSSGVGTSQNLVGKWTRSGGAGGFRDYTGKTRYNSGESISFEFFADGTMQFLNKKETLSITQCRINETTKIPGKYSVSGDELIMNLGTGTSVGTSSCETKDNFKKTLSASTATKKFVVKKMESVFRPDSPLILCFDGNEGDNACFERDSKQ